MINPGQTVAGDAERKSLRQQVADGRMRSMSLSELLEKSGPRGRTTPIKEPIADPRAALAPTRTGHAPAAAAGQSSSIVDIERRLELLERRSSRTVDRIDSALDDVQSRISVLTDRQHGGLPDRKVLSAIDKAFEDLNRLIAGEDLKRSKLMQDLDQTTRDLSSRVEKAEKRTARALTLMETAVANQHKSSTDQQRSIDGLRAQFHGLAERLNGTEAGGDDRLKMLEANVASLARVTEQIETTIRTRGTERATPVAIDEEARAEIIAKIEASEKRSVDSISAIEGAINDIVTWLDDTQQEQKSVIDTICDAVNDLSARLAQMEIQAGSAPGTVFAAAAPVAATMPVSAAPASETQDAPDEHEVPFDPSDLTAEAEAEAAHEFALEAEARRRAEEGTPSEEEDLSIRLGSDLLPPTHDAAPEAGDAAEWTSAWVAPTPEPQREAQREPTHDVSAAPSLAAPTLAAPTLAAAAPAAPMTIGDLRSVKPRPERRSGKKAQSSVAPGSSGKRKVVSRKSLRGLFYGSAAAALICGTVAGAIYWSSSSPEFRTVSERFWTETSVGRLVGEWALKLAKGSETLMIMAPSLPPVDPTEARERGALMLLPDNDLIGERTAFGDLDAQLAAKGDSAAAKAIELLPTAAQAGDTAAQFMLARGLELGKTFDVTPADPMHWYEKAASSGLVDAQFISGLRYAHGEGVPRDNAAAAHYFKRAAEQGHAFAMYNLGLAYAKGLGVPQDFAKAQSWLAKAAERNVLEAQINLGFLKQHGFGGAVDKQAALTWYAIAAAQGDRGAEAARDVLARMMGETFVAEAEAGARKFEPVVRETPASVTVARAESLVDITLRAAVGRAQAMLASIGYPVDGARGVLGPITQESIRSFERKMGLLESGQVSAPLFERLDSIVD